MGYMKISLPSGLADEIKKLVDSGRYTSVAEFVKEAVRLRLEEVKKSER